jgi:hypothetical protein
VKKPVTSSDCIDLQLQLQHGGFPVGKPVIVGEVLRTCVARYVATHAERIEPAKEPTPAPLFPMDHIPHTNC